MLKILIADDEMPIRQWFEFVIRQYPEEFEIVGLCSNGLQALRVFEEEQPDIIIADIVMPVMDGLELIREVRQRGAGTPFLVLSNYDNFEYVKKGFAFGAKDYLLKGETDDEDIIRALRKIRAEMFDARKQERSSYESLLSELLKRGGVEPSHRRKVSSYLDENCRELIRLLAEGGTIEHEQAARDLIVGHLQWIELHVCKNHAKYSEPTNAIIDFLLRNYHLKVEMRQLAHLVHLHENYISQLFKKDTNVSVTQFLLKIRMVRAKMLLHTKKHKIYEIANLTGYMNESHFCTTFKGVYGKSPTQYMQNPDE